MFVAELYGSMVQSCVDDATLLTPIHGTFLMFRASSFAWCSSVIRRSVGYRFTRRVEVDDGVVHVVG